MAVMPNVTLVELTPLKSAFLVWRSQRSGPMLSIVSKATYKLVKGVSPLADVQDDVNERDLHKENNPSMGLHSSSDLVPFKPRADVTLVGKAYAPPGELAQSLIARLHVGSVDKHVAVHAERYLSRSGRVKADKFFSKMPLGYERAPGGKGTDNPVGLHLGDRPDSRGRVRLPNLQRPDETIGGRDTKLSPIGFGPIPASWPSRAARVDQDAPWLTGDFLAGPIADDQDWAFFNVAPRDQQLPVILDDQLIVLEHLHPEEPKLATRLPGIRPTAFVERAGGAQPLPMRGDTLWIDTNRLVQTVTWRAQLPLESLDGPVRVLVAHATPELEPTWDQACERAQAPKPDEEEERKPLHRPIRHAGPMSVRSHITSPVPLVPTNDHTPVWVPTSPGSSENAAAPMSSAHPPVSSARVPGSGYRVEVALDDADTMKLRLLCESLGCEPAEALRYLLREAHKQRFG